MSGVISSDQVTFGPWRYDRRVNTLVRLSSTGDWIPVAIGARALQVLSALLRDPGALVSKDALMDAVWPGLVVEANNLTVQIAALRRVLDEGSGSESCIQTVPGRGYRFTRPVQCTDAVLAAAVGTPRKETSAVELTDPLASDEPPERKGVLRRQIDWLRGGPGRRSMLAYSVYVVIALLTCLIGGSAIWTLTRTSIPRAVLPARQQVAVLPLRTIGGSDEYFADGMTEDLIAELGRFPEIAVRSRDAVIGYKDHPGTPDDIGRTLAVGYIVEGSVQRASDHVRVVVRLIGAKTGTVLWSGTHDAELKDVFALQDDITRGIAGVVSVQLDHLALALAAAKPPDKLEAYDLVLQGRQRLQPVTRVGTSEARALFERAIALDPNYAAAYVGLGRADIQAVEHGWTGDPQGTLSRAIAHGRQAVALQEGNPSAHAVLGRALVRVGNYDGALDELKRAVALNPSDPEAIMAYGDVLSLSGDSKAAIPWMEEAARYRPNRPAGEYFSLGIAYILDGRPADAARIFEQGRTSAGQLTWFSVLLAISYTQLDRTADAAREAANVRRLIPGFDASTFASLMRRPEDRDLMRAALRRAGL